MSEIIINGIDVSECDYYNKDNEPFCCEIWDNECEAQDCYFKQSKRLKQQIEAYQLSENKAKEIIAELKHRNKRLQEENEELREEKDGMQIVIDNYIEHTTKYKQALEEIRNIAEKLITELPEYNSCYYKDECGDNCTPKKQSKVEYCCYENVDKILTMINEVLNNETTKQFNQTNINI